MFSFPGRGLAAQRWDDRNTADTGCWASKLPYHQSETYCFRGPRLLQHYIAHSREPSYFFTFYLVLACTSMAVSSLFRFLGERRA